jgi:hypothetical protein
MDRSSLLSLRHYRRCVFRRPGHFASIFVRPFAPPELPGFYATMDALTSERRLFVPVGSHAGIRHMNTVLPVQISLLNVVESFDHSISNHRLPSPDLVWFSVRDLPRGTASRPSPSRRTLASFGLRQWGAGSPRQTAESSSLALWTGRSPPVALHPASRRRSYVRLQRSNQH